VDKKSPVSIVIPTLNEEANIHELCLRLAKSLAPVTKKYELIFIDDHSEDKTLAEIKAMQRQLPVTVHLKNGQPGKSFSVLEGIAVAQYEIIGMIDADLQYPPEVLPAMIEKVTVGGAGLVVGRRRENNSKLTRKIGTWLIYNFLRLLFSVNADVQSGLKVFKKELAAPIDAKTLGPWTLDLQLLQNAKRQKYPIVSVDLVFRKRLHGKSKIHLFRAGSSIIFDALKLKLRRT
jgi:dolichol-phosphate mannosyltransferase